MLLSSLNDHFDIGFAVPHEMFVNPSVDKCVEMNLMASCTHSNLHAIASFLQALGLNRPDISGSVITRIRHNWT